MSEEIKTESVDPQTAFGEIFKHEEYRQKLAQMAIHGAKSFELKFMDIVRLNVELAEKLLQKPFQYFEHASNAAMGQMGIEDLEYSSKLKKITVRIIDMFKATPLRKVGSDALGKLIMVNGIVVRASFGKPRVMNASFECKRCGTRFMVIQSNTSAVILKKPLECLDPSCRREGPFEFVEEESEMVDEQEIWIQESPDELPPGQMPRTAHLKLYEDIVDVARPGDIVSVVGIVKSLPKRVKGGTLNTFETFLEVSSVKVLGKEPEAVSNPEELNRVMELAKDPFVLTKILSSIAPSIYGYEHIKEAIMYLLFGGVAKERSDIKIRGELNILLIGDPGVSKTQLLRYVARIAPRGLYTSGRGTTGVGLTACVLKDPETQSYTLEAGALVLADKGVACIDEMDKMHDSDRETIHETLEQRTVSIAKGGIVATLNARCAVLAAANPLMGRYNSRASIVENISLPVTLLSRFDLIFLMRDVPEVQHDTDLSAHILGIHSGASVEPAVEPALLRKYIAHAQQLNPDLTKEATTIIQEFYLRMRKASSNEGSPLAIGPRQLEALTRLSEARARACMREKVTVDDAVAAIQITTRSLEEVGIDLGSGKVDIDLLMTGKPKNARDKVGVVMKKVLELSKDSGMVETEILYEKLQQDCGLSHGDSAKFVGQLLRQGALFEPREGFLKKT